jgi:hypothetical protein
MAGTGNEGVGSTDIFRHRSDWAERIGRGIVANRFSASCYNNAPTGERNELVRQTIRRF